LLLQQYKAERLKAEVEADVPLPTRRDTTKIGMEFQERNKKIVQLKMQKIEEKQRKGQERSAKLLNMATKVNETMFY
jgi:hypothetical protein